jgi:hypothetical protein
MHDFEYTHHQTSNHYKMVDEHQMKLAIRSLKSSKKLNFAAVGRKYNILPTTLSRRFYGQTRSRADRAQYEQRWLTDAQERRILGQINWLSSRGIHSTPRILKRTVEELLKHKVGKNWVRRFQIRHKDTITSLYLKGVDRERKIADNPAIISKFFENVSKFIVI